jgi:orotidine-5'-phosphate decarboxylase
VRPFGERVVEAVGATGPLCAGLDPSAAVLAAWGLPDDAGGLRDFGARCVEALAGVVPVVKPQVAFFERHGAAGMAALEAVMAEATSAGLLVIADAKRGDIGSTAEAYAQAWYDGPLAADAVTAHPYLGYGTLAPMVAAARRTGRGLLVVVASSNPEGRSLQEAVTAAGNSVEEALFGEIAGSNRDEGAAVGSVGAVVGATRAPPGVPLASVGGVLLAPGVGAQGATAADVGALFEGCAPGTVLPSVSRELLSAGPAGLREAAARARDEMAAVVR